MRQHAKEIETDGIENMQDGYVKVSVQIPVGGRKIGNFYISKSEKNPIKNINGIATHDIVSDVCFFKDIQGYWRQHNQSMDLDFDELCRKTHGAIRESIVNDIEIGIATGRFTKEVYIAGIEPESRMDSGEFNRLVSQSSNDELLNRMLYLMDVQSLLSNIQITSSQIFQNMGQFYGMLNDGAFYSYSEGEKFGLRSSMSGETRLLHSYIENIFVRMRSILDYCVKLACEVERGEVKYNQYPRLIGKSKQYKDRKKLRMGKIEKTVFIEDEKIRTISSIRDRIIHDGHFDTSTRVYENFKNGALVERFIFVPDMFEGHFERFRNRHSFYSRDNKINLTLPSEVSEFYSRLYHTVDVIKIEYEKKKRK